MEAEQPAIAKAATALIVAAAERVRSFLIIIMVTILINAHGFNVNSPDRYQIETKISNITQLTYNKPVINTANPATQPPSDPESTPKLKAPWQRLAALLITSQGISLIGSAIVQYAMVWYITLTTKSGTMIAIATICAFLPAFLLSPIAGVWADRYNRRVLIVLSDTIVAITTLGIMIAFIVGYRSLPLMFAVLTIRGAAGAVQSPAASAIIPSFIPTNHLRRVNGIMGMVQSLSAIAAPALGGIVMAIWPLHAVFAIDIITAIIGITIFWFFVKVPAYGERTDNLGSWRHEFTAGLRYVRHHNFYPVLFTLIAASLFVIAAPLFLANLHVARIFGAEPWRLSIVETGYGIGAVIGGAAVSIWVGLRRETTTSALAITLMGAVVIALAFAPNFWSFVLIMGALGVVFHYINSPLLSLMQRTCDPRHLGKVMSLLMMLNTAIVPLGMVLFGPLADYIPVWQIMTAGGLAQIIIGLIMLRHPRLRTIPTHQPN